MSKKINNTPRRLLTASVSLALLISLSSCSGATNTTGNLIADKEYASAGTGDSKVAVSYGDLWNELQWNANTVLNDQITNVILNEKITKINKIVNAESYDKLDDKENLVEENKFKGTKEFYEERLVDYVVQDIYDQTFSKDGYWKAIEGMKENAKKVAIEKYIDSMYLTYHKYLNDDKNQYAKDLLEASEEDTKILLDTANFFKDVYYPLLAKELLAYENLEEQIEKAAKDDKDTQDDKEGYFTHSQFKNKFESEKSNTYDLNLVMIRFTSEKEFEDTLRAFGIKIHDKKYYFVYDKDGASGSLTYEEYIKRYDDLKSYDNANETDVVELDGSMVLELYIQLYNYIYGGFKGELPSAYDFDFSNINNLRTQFYNSVVVEYGKLDVNARKEKFNANAAALKQNDVTVFDSKELNDISSTFKDYAYETLKTPSDNYEGAYSTSSQSANSGYYIAYRYADKYDELTGDAKAYEEYFRDNELTSYEVYDDIFGKEGKFKDTGLADELLILLKKDQLTDTLINSALDEEKKEVKVKIYNEALEISYKKDHPDYSKTLNGADKNLLATITYNDKTFDLNISNKNINNEATTLKFADGTPVGAFEILEQKMGSTVAIDLIADQIVKTTDEYAEAKKDKESISYYEEYLDTLLVNFANGGLAQQGYDASIGKYDFLMLYFHTADVNEIIDNYYLVQHAASKLLTNYANEDLASFFNTYTDLAYDKYFSLSGSRLVVYMDADDDNVADKSADWADDKVTFRGQAEVKRSDIARELVLELYNKVTASTMAHKDKMTALVDEFNNSARAEYDGNPIAPENNWAEYRKLGFKLKIEEFTATNSDVEIDRALKNRLAAYATDEAYEFFTKNGEAPTAYIEKLGESNKDQIVQTEDGFNLILVTAGQSKPSAKYEQKKDNDSLLTNITLKYNGKYLDKPIEDVYNDTDKLNNKQIRLFLVDNAVNGQSTLSPASTSGALTTFLQPVLQRYSSAETQRIVLLNFIKLATNQKDDTALYDVITYDTDLKYNGKDQYLDKVIKINQSIVDNYNYIYDDEYTEIFKDWWKGIEENVSKFTNTSKGANK